MMKLCPRCERPLTRENAPFFVCEHCQALYEELGPCKGARESWVKHALPNFTVTQLSVAALAKTERE